MNPRIEEFLNNGYITKEAAERLETFDDMLKEAGILSSLRDAILATAKQMGPIALGSAVGLYGADYLTGRHHQKIKENEQHNLNASLGTVLMQNKELADNREKAKDRFREISHFSPTLASMPSVVAPMIKRTLTTGLDERDVRNLVQIEAGKQQSGSRSIPTSARLMQSVVGPSVTSMGQGLMNIQSDPNVKLHEFGMEAFTPIMKMLAERGLMPSDVAQFFKNPEGQHSDETVQKAQAFAENNPGFIMESAQKHNLYDEINNISGMHKSASVSGKILENVPMEKRAEMLADQYVLIKCAGLADISRDVMKKMMPSLMGLGAAALFGAAGSVVEQGVDFARTEKSNKRIQTAWETTKGKLKKMNEEGSVMASGIDYGDKENLRKAEEAFKVLVDVAPALAQNATIATPFVNRVVQQDGDITPDVIKQLAETQKNISSSRQYRSPFADSPLAQGFGRMFGAAGGGKAVDNFADDLGKS